MSEKVEKLAEDIKKLSPEGQAVVGMMIDATTKPTKPATDIFAWANNLVSDRDEYDVQLFFLSKNYVVYSLNTAPALQERLRAVFLDSVMEDVLSAVDKGGIVLPYDQTLKGDKNIAWLPVDTTNRVRDILTWLEEHAIDIARFIEDEHDIKRMKGIFAKFTKPGAKTFYSFKQFSGGQAVQAKKDFVLRDNRMEDFYKDTAFKIAENSQVVVVDNDIFVFSQSKFESLFDTKPHQTAVANRNGLIIDQQFKLSMPLLVKEVAILAQQNGTALKKLAAIDPYAMTQAQAVEAIEEYGVPLMLDDSGAIILMDAKDVVCFLDVLSDNYLHGINGDYLAKSKKPFVGDQNQEM